MGRRSRVALGFAVLAFALGVAAARVKTRSTGGGVELGAAWAMADFRNTVYFPVRFFLEGGNPYNRQSYHDAYPRQEPFPPFMPSTLLIHAPLGLLPLTAAEWCYALALVVMTVAVVRRGFRRRDGGGTAMAAGATLLSRPGQWNLLLGQVALQAVLACHAALRTARTQPWRAGFALGLSTFKPTFGFPLAVLMLARGDGRAVAAGVAAGLALNLPVVAVLAEREGSIGRLIETLVRGQREWNGGRITGHQWTESLGATSYAVHRIDLVALAGRFVPGNISGAGTDLLFTFIVLGIAVVALRRIAKHAPERVNDLGDPVICLAVLLSVYHLTYDELLVVPFAVALVRREASGSLHEGARRWVMLGAFAALAANYASTQGIVGRFAGNNAAWLVLSSINPVLLLVLFAAYTAAALERTRASRPIAQPAKQALAR